MTDVTETPTPAEVETPDSAEARRGRPRPDTTIERDGRVLAALETTSKTRQQLAEELELDGKQVYLSLYRLQHAGTIVRTREGSNHVWTKKTATV